MITAQVWMDELKRPMLWQSGESLWTHPHIATEMLKAHLSPETDAASYKPDTIQAICDHLHGAMQLDAGKRVVDLGCGLGLYCHTLGQKGLTMLGIDLSENSVQYARALCADVDAEFCCASYLQPFANGAFDAAIMVSQDYGVLAPAQREQLLGNIRAALKDGGLFAFDVPTLAAFAKRSKNTVATWETAPSGFWRPHPYVLLQKTNFYPEQHTLCDLYCVVDDTVATYRIWQTYFSKSTITRELAAAGFAVDALWGSLIGEPYAQTGLTLGVLCRKL